MYSFNFIYVDLQRQHSNPKFRCAVFVKIRCVVRKKVFEYLDVKRSSETPVQTTFIIFLHACGCFQCGCFVGALPSKFRLLAAEVAVGGGFAVNRAQQVEHLDDAFRAQVEMFANQGDQFFFADFASAESIDGNRSRFGNADGVGYLDLALGCQTGGYDIFRNIAAGVSGGTVHFGRVFAGECAAAVRSCAAVGINDDFTAGQTAVALRAADNEAAGRVEQGFGFVG